MERRQFIKNAGALGLPFMLNGMNLTALYRPFFFGNLDDQDRVLVLVRLNGGNDGLNTLIPLDQYSNLYRARPNILIPENALLPVTGSLGFHPAMAGMKSLYDEGELKIVQSVGYPNHNRSHFRSMEIWQSGYTDLESIPSGISTGWLGRYLDDQYDNFPDAYPNKQFSDPFAISMGYYVSETCQGKAANFSMSLEDPFSLEPFGGEMGDPAYGPYFRDELDFVKRMVSQTNGYSGQILKAAKKGKSRAAYPETELAQQLKNAAILISGGLKTKIYIVDLGGFDTHAGQVTTDNPLAGRHADLLQTFSDAIKAFQEDLRMLDLEERVMGMTFSEFGRQILANNGLGTDHGEAAPLFLFGSCVNPQILGQNPRIPAKVQVQEAVPMQYDFRDVYGTILQDWFGLPKADVRRLVYSDFNKLPLFSNCGLTTGVGSVEEPPIDTYCYPNPFRDWTTIHFVSGNERVRLSVYDARGSEIGLLTDQRLIAGAHEVRFDSRDLPPGNYFYRLETGEGRQRTVRMVKIR